MQDKTDEIYKMAIEQKDTKTALDVLQFQYSIGINRQSLTERVEELENKVEQIMPTLR